jgi:hypothetical protein
MIEIGRSLPNLTVPVVTTGAAVGLVLKALSLFGPTMPGRFPRINPLKPFWQL